MSISVGRALVIHRPFLKVRQKILPMDEKLYVTILREQSEQVVQFATSLSADLKQFEQSLHEQRGSPSTNRAVLSNRLVRLQKILAAETNVFCKRLQKFLERLGVIPSPNNAPE
jgi:hypothetical protein